MKPLKNLTFKNKNMDYDYCIGDKENCGCSNYWYNEDDIKSACEWLKKELFVEIQPKEYAFKGELSTQMIIEKLQEAFEDVYYE